MVPLSPATLARLGAVFDPSHREAARSLLERHCADNLPSCSKCGPVELERIRFAVLKLSRGDLKRLDREIREAQKDWRDTLMAADFGLDVNAHLNWHP
jgi:hypothetical protein